jgi:hypothetical protein
MNVLNAKVQYYEFNVSRNQDHSVQQLCHQSQVEQQLIVTLGFTLLGIK